MVQILKSVKEKFQQKKENNIMKNKMKKNNYNTTSNKPEFVKEGFFTVREGLGPGISCCDFRLGRPKKDSFGDILRREGDVIFYAVLFLALYTIIGYSTACMLTRYSHYIAWETNPKNNKKPAFLGINGLQTQQDKTNGIINFDHVYYTEQNGNTKNDKKNIEEGEDDIHVDDVKIDVQGEGIENPKTVTTMGIQRAGIGHKNLIAMWSYKDTLKEINKTSGDGDGNPVRLRKIAAMNMSSLRESYKQLMKYLVTEEPEPDSNAFMEKQINHWYFVLYPFIMIIGAIIVTPLVTIVTSTFINGPASKGVEHGGISSYLFGFVEGIMDMVVYTLYGLGVILGGHLSVKNVRTDFFGPDGITKSVDYTNPSFTMYCRSAIFWRFLLIWAAGTVFATAWWVPTTPVHGVWIVLGSALWFWLSGYKWTDSQTPSIRV